jgi:hypothetical protein
MDMYFSKIDFVCGMVQQRPCTANNKKSNIACQISLRFVHSSVPPRLRACACSVLCVASGNDGSTIGTCASAEVELVVVVVVVVAAVGVVEKNDNKNDDSTEDVDVDGVVALGFVEAADLMKENTISSCLAFVSMLYTCWQLRQALATIEKPRYFKNQSIFMLSPSIYSLSPRSNQLLRRRRRRAPCTVAAIARHRPCRTISKNTAHSRTPIFNRTMLSSLDCCTTVR